MTLACCSLRSAPRTTPGTAIGQLTWDVLPGEFDRSPLNVGQATLTGGDEGPAEEVPGPLHIAGPAAGEEHPAPLQLGAGQPDRGGDALVGGGSSREAALRLLEIPERRGQQTQVVGDVAQ